MSLQLPPPASQRRHWYAYEIGCVPDHEPGSADKTCPACAKPLTVGNELFAGATGAAATTSSEERRAGQERSASVPATATRNDEPTTAPTAVYASAPAPALALQLP